jgi:hypothetical protein
MLSDFNATETCLDFYNLRFRISKPSNKSEGWRYQTKLKLKQRPLIVMECSVISDAYMGLGYGEETKVLMVQLKQASQALGGNFVLLWHNSHFQNMKDKALFEKLVIE